MSNIVSWVELYTFLVCIVVFKRACYAFSYVLTYIDIYI